MLPASLVLAFLIITTPAILIFDGPVIRGLVIVVAAISVAIVALRIRPGEAGFLALVFRPIAIIATVPALWIIIQILPVKVVGLANPIWESAATVLGHPLTASISVDPGATLIALDSYLSLVGIVFAATAVAIDRQRAEGIFYLLTAIAGLTALIALVIGFGGFASLSNTHGGSVIDAATDVAGLGIILAIAAGFHSYERWKIRPDQGKAAAWLPRVFFISLGIVAICTLAMIVTARRETYFAVACGIATLAVAVETRRVGLGPWGYAAVASVALVFALAAVAFHRGATPTDLTVAFATRAPPPVIALTQRVLMETRWTGTGAGTFAAVLPIYRGADELASGPIAPTAAAKMAVEMGRPFFWAIVAAAFAIAITLWRRALRRGRDSLFSIAGASCLVTITLLGFGNVGVLSAPVLVTASVIVGIAIAQSKSRSI